MADYTKEQEKFVLTAITALRREGSKYIHSTFSGFNEAFRKAFPGADPVTVVKALEGAGKIFTAPRRGGVAIGLPADKPVSKGESALEAINKALGK